MKKIFVAVIIAALTSYVFAYNPPAGGQHLYNLTSPYQLSNASSAVGGALFRAEPGAIVFNPAITAYEDRPQVDLGVTVLANAGAAYQTGIVVPLKMFVLSGLVQGVHSNVADMDLGDSLTMHFGLSKEVIECISVGANVYSGFLFSDGGDFSVGADLGALFRKEKVGFMKDFRIGASLLNMGKGFKGTKHGLYENEMDYKYDNWGYFKGEWWSPYHWYRLGRFFDDGHNTDTFPGMFTIRSGIAATMFETEKVKGGVSADFTIVGFQDAIFDYGFQISIGENLLIRAAQTYNMLELYKPNISDPVTAVSVAYKFVIPTGGDYMKKHNWEKSELTVSSAVSTLYDDIFAVSTGANLKFGRPDEEAPSIEVWND